MLTFSFKNILSNFCSISVTNKNVAFQKTNLLDINLAFSQLSIILLLKRVILYKYYSQITSKCVNLMGYIYYSTVTGKLIQNFFKMAEYS